MAAGPPPLPTPGRDAPVIYSAPGRCRLSEATLLIPAFRIERHGLAYRSGTDYRIDLGEVAPGRYQVLAVHNFHVEDRNPDLRACIAGVFLAARRADGSWEEPERFPIECRTLAVLGEVEGEAGPGGAAWCWIEP
jgi:hypothetical protein